MPSGVATKVATAATRSESCIAIHSVGEISNTGSGARANQRGEPVFLKRYLGLRRAQERQIVCGLRLRGRGSGDRIDDRRGGVPGETLALILSVGLAWVGCG